MSAVIAVDAGNTRIKWGVHDGRAWLAQGALATSEVDALREVADAWPTPARLAVCNVAGASVERALSEVFAAGRAPVRWLRASAAACGVESRYEWPETLGADRWAALIGARGLVAGACLVVSAGTATTVDLLDADGVFQGGAILPGYELMRRALAGNTAQLLLAEGRYAAPPRNTQDAIVSGCLHAQAGAIERLYRQLPTGAPCLLTGGAAPLLAGCLDLPLRRVDNLVLEGLRRYADSI